MHYFQHSHGPCDSKVEANAFPDMAVITEMRLGPLGLFATFNMSSRPTVSSYFYRGLGADIEGEDAILLQPAAHRSLPVERLINLLHDILLALFLHLCYRECITSDALANQFQGGFGGLGGGFDDRSGAVFGDEQQISDGTQQNSGGDHGGFDEELGGGPRGPSVGGFDGQQHCQGGLQQHLDDGLGGHLGAQQHLGGGLGDQSHQVFDQGFGGDLGGEQHMVQGQFQQGLDHLGADPSGPSHFDDDPGAGDPNQSLKDEVYQLCQQYMEDHDRQDMDDDEQQDTLHHHGTNLVQMLAQLLEQEPNNPGAAQLHDWFSRATKGKFYGHEGMEAGEHKPRYPRDDDPQDEEKEGQDPEQDSFGHEDQHPGHDFNGAYGQDHGDDGQGYGDDGEGYGDDEEGGYGDDGEDGKHSHGHSQGRGPYGVGHRGPSHADHHEGEYGDGGEYGEDGQYGGDDGQYGEHGQHTHVQQHSYHQGGDDNEYDDRSQHYGHQQHGHDGGQDQYGGDDQY
ncbi:hypothetical protein EDD36DRAFT_281637 [Exophiala viscosa]|uniref:Uncharacterized protein n=1 Tax=Exophiala viscosa TaxID=2486360 RepID=A0AAN6DVC0_9EURO|nr:hypothetical protein EDD36DRAFT_281637 [Exophiala viscosa]